MLRRLFLTAIFTTLCLAGLARGEELRVGANIGNVPWEFADRGGEFVGFEIDLVREAAAQLGHSVRIINIPFNGLFSAVQSGRIDIALSSMTITEKRLASVAFAQPYYDSAQSLTVLSSSPASGLEDLRGAVIGVDTGSTGDMWTTANRERYGFGDIRRFEGLAPAMLDLQTRRIDGYISDIPALAWYVKDKPQFRVIERIETGERYSMMFARDSRWLEPIDAAITELKRAGRLAALHERWFGTTPDPASSTVRVTERPGAAR
jgi:polar amino acid transport system substrate-binding protein